MGVRGHKERLFEDVLRLRRAQRRSPADEDLSIVRGDLERMLGSTVRRAFAARVLGVSQTALDRWIAQGDIPSVITPTGSREVPLSPLLDLVEAVGMERTAGDHMHPLAAVLRRRRARAARLDLDAILPRRPRRGVSGHEAADLRSLAYHRAVAQSLDRRTVDDALRRIRRWRSEGKVDPRYAERWEKILARPLPEIARLLRRDDQTARELRQSSPFAGALSEPERRLVLEAAGRAAR